MSSAFNAKAGARIDKALAEEWAEICLELGPLLPSEFDTASLKFTQDDESFRSLTRGRIALSKSNVNIGRDGTLLSVLTSTPSAAERFAKKHKKVSSNFLVVEYPPPTQSNLFDTPARPITSVASEVAALKALLVAFDTANSHSPSSWVRSEDTFSARKLVLDYVCGTEPNSLALSSHLLGYEPALVEHVRYLSNESGQTPSIFEHIMCVVGDPVRGKIFGFWLIFGHVAIQFCLSHAYRGPGFVELLGCDPLKDGVSWGPVRLHYRKMDIRKGLTAVDATEGFLFEVLWQQRTHLHGLAHAISRIRCKEHAAELLGINYFRYEQRFGFLPSDVGQLLNFVILGYQPDKIRAVVLKRLKGFSLLSTKIPATQPWPKGKTPDWVWRLVPCYRRCLSDLLHELGPPTLIVGRKRAASDAPWESTSPLWKVGEK